MSVGEIGRARHLGPATLVTAWEAIVDEIKTARRILPPIDVRVIKIIQELANGRRSLTMAQARTKAGLGLELLEYSARSRNRDVKSEALELAFSLAVNLVSLLTDDRVTTIGNTRPLTSDTVLPDGMRARMETVRAVFDHIRKRERERAAARREATRGAA